MNKYYWRQRKRKFQLYFGIFNPKRKYLKNSSYLRLITGVERSGGGGGGLFEKGAQKSFYVTNGAFRIQTENNKMFRTTPAHVTEQLGLLLNSVSAKNWKVLAGKLEYDVTYTQSFGLTPTEATQRLLQDWQQKSGATIFVLYTHLKEMGRDDAAAKLLPYLGEQDCETRAETV